MTTSQKSIAEMSSDDLCDLYDKLKSEVREAIQTNAPAELVLQAENELRRVGNQLRRRGL
ncbi:hypothetical protein HQ346_18555 [Rhodococcus sp. BP-252]|uniref:hypothetical protein n=1 Tax=unclassified Rhodococcus (in: high G+C Gram-positive bacteria) TaxID=192944 RepID=UPI0014311BE9|nr:MULTISPECIES: hypothetical protein [unclassified Rhodococcus (in: high G+C Gram-positive bacteria)]MBY6413619.1 hypothetical protein [Rhodococcus sp. BP-320]MBY6418394.1 hypothetical protein [Rhodococcus sp. BP-321]MBY6422519.1 hypothetical protein [Rhodococcus sp. BP-324]MBY6428339.1 hypothetical protein [Rhodococcus sp. BP-323]MBY6433516.1 hypothetical protein [Rhodococcus sp. BP-322]